MFVVVAFGRQTCVRVRRNIACQNGRVAPGLAIHCGVVMLSE